MNLRYQMRQPQKGDSVNKAGDFKRKPDLPINTTQGTVCRQHHLGGSGHKDKKSPIKISIGLEATNIVQQRSPHINLHNFLKDAMVLQLQ